ncbi:MAG: hypothetical protein IPH62_19775 [Ignavibacteriae bacterium]|nr:hypothetical protein [Ignavibacteriota bacterium]
MDGSQLRDLIGQKRPRYNTQYRALIEAISNKGDSTGKGDFSSFGAFYQTYMYAFIIGYKLGTPKYILGNDKTDDFFVFSNWKPTSMRDYINMLLLNNSEEFGFNWIELENASEDLINTFVTELIRQMEGYANAGFEYLQSKWDNENMKFRNPFVFVNLLEELNS